MIVMINITMIMMMMMIVMMMIARMIVTYIPGSEEKDFNSSNMG
jgi:flagellar basal body-associated protein FliL